jgi:hypothetical protein
LVADVVKASVPPALQRLVIPDIAVGVPTNGFTVTFVETGDEEPQPLLATTDTVAAPEKLEAQVTVAELPVPETVLPLPVTLHV